MMDAEAHRAIHDFLALWDTADNRWAYNACVEAISVDPRRAGEVIACIMAIVSIQADMLSRLGFPFATFIEDIRRSMR